MTINQIPWEALATALTISGVLVYPHKLIKQWFKHHDKVMITVVAVVSMLASAGHYLLNTPTDNPTIIATQTAVLAFMTQPFYFFVIKPLVGVFARAAAFNAQVETALQPVAIPETETTPVVEAVQVVPVADSDVHAFDN